MGAIKKWKWWIIGGVVVLLVLWRVCFGGAPSNADDVLDHWVYLPLVVKDFDPGAPTPVPTETAEPIATATVPPTATPTNTATATRTPMPTSTPFPVWVRVRNDTSVDVYYHVLGDDMSWFPPVDWAVPYGFVDVGVHSWYAEVVYPGCGGDWPVWQAVGEDLFKDGPLVHIFTCEDEVLVGELVAYDPNGTPTPTATPVATATGTATPTSTSTSTSTPTSTPTATDMPTATATPTATSTPVCEFTVPKDISTNTIWQAGCTYIAPNGVLVKAGALLTIPEGVTVLMGSWKTFLVQGTLHVRGTAAEPVVMRRQLEDLSWTGLSFQSASQPTSDLTYLTLEGGYSGLAVYSGSVWSTNCIFEGWRPFGER